MSDRVWFATRDNTITPASSSGFSGFPFRVIKAASGAEVGAGTSFPLGMTLTEAVELCWRIKSVEFDTDASLTDGVDTFSAIDYAFSANAITRERDICNATLGQGQQAPSGPYNPPGLNWTLGHYYRPFGGSVVANARIKEWAGSYYPNFDIVCQLVWDLGGSSDSLFLATDLAYVPVPDGSFTATLGSHSFPMYHLFSGATLTPTISYYDLTITAYWPYAASDGTPIYNTSTGALLQDPTN